VREGIERCDELGRPKARADTGWTGRADASRGGRPPARTARALVEAGRPGLIPALILYHPDRAVVTAAMRHFAGAPRPDVDAMLPFLVRHADPEVRATAVGRWLTAGRSVDEVRPFLEDPAPRVRASALIALAGASQGDPSFGPRMFSIVREGTDEDRRALAWAIATAPRPELLPVVMALFSTGDVETRRELLRAVRELPAPPASLVSRIVEMLTNPSLRTGLQDALLAMGQPAREYLEKLLLSDTTSFVIARELPAALARFPPDEAAPVLLRRLAQPRGGLDRFRSLVPSTSCEGPIPTFRWTGGCSGWPWSSRLQPR